MPFLCRLFSIGVLVSPLVGCQSQVQKTNVDMGGGMVKGTPPMCYQYKAEARKTLRAYDIWLHVNNTCRYQVDCTYYDDITEKQARIVQPAYQSGSLVLALNVPDKRVDVDLECIWKP